MSVMRSELFLIARTETGLDNVDKDMQTHTGWIVHDSHNFHLSLHIYMDKVCYDV